MDEDVTTLYWDFSEDPDSEKESYDWVYSEDDVINMKSTKL